MNHYGIQMQGPLVVQQVAGLPSWQSSDEGRLIYDTVSNTAYIGGAAAWESITVTSSLLSAAGFLNEAQASQSLAQQYSGWVRKGRATASGFTAVNGGLSVKTSPAGADANKLWLDSRTATLALDGSPQALVNGKVLNLIKTVSGGDFVFPVTLNAAPSSGYRQDLMFLEVWLKKISTSSPSFYPYGHVNYDPDGDGNFAEHLVTSPSDSTVADTVGFLPDGNYFQVQYRIRVVDGPANTDWLAPDGATPFGLGHASVLGQGSTGAPVVAKTFTRMTNLTGDLGLWRAGTGGSGDKDGSGLDTADGYVYSLSLVGVHRRNTDVWALDNGNGTAATAGAGNGSIANGAGANGRPDGLYYDQVAARDVVDLRMFSIPSQSHDSLLGRILNKLLTGSFVVDWANAQWGVQSMPTSTLTNSGVRGTELLEAAGVGANESAVFGTHNIGVFINESLNGFSAVTDNVRRQWHDAACTMPNVATATQGNASSEAPSNVFTYTPAGPTIALNSTALSGNPNIGSSTPVAQWFNSSTGAVATIVLNGSWSGLGTQSASATIDGADHSAHPGPNWKIVIQYNLEYEAGGGLKEVMGSIVDVEDGTNPWSWTEDVLSSFTRSNTAQGGSSSTIQLDTGASSVDGTYVGEWVTHVPTGQNFLITGYVGSTRTATVSGTFSPVPASGDDFTISPIQADVTYLRIDRSTRGWSDQYFRTRVATNAAGSCLAPGYVLFASEGSVSGAIVTGASASAYVEVVYCPGIAIADILRVWYTRKPQKEQFQTFAGPVTLLAQGYLVASSDGTANEDSANYFPFSDAVPVLDTEYVIGDGVTNETAVNNLQAVGHNGDYPLPGLVLNNDGTTDLGGTIQPNVTINAGTGLAAIFQLVETAAGEIKLLMGTRRAAGAMALSSATHYRLAPILDRTLVRAK